MSVKVVSEASAADNAYKKPIKFVNLISSFRLASL